MLSDQSGEQGSGMYLPWLIGGWGAMGWGPSGLAPGKVAELVFNPLTDQLLEAAASRKGVEIWCRNFFWERIVPGR